MFTVSLDVVCVITILVSTYAEVRKVTILKNQTLQNICKRTDACMQYCNYGVCRGNTLGIHQITSVTDEGNKTHWWTSMPISTTGSWNCFLVYRSSISCSNPTSTIYVSLYELNNTMVEPNKDPIVIREGETLTVNCSVESVPNVTMTWVTPREDITVYETLKDELVVENLTFTDSGVYQCSAWNEPLRLRSTKFFNVSVHCAPRTHDPIMYPSKIWFVPGQTIHLKAVFDANPPPVFTWKKKSEWSSHTLEDDERITTRQTDSLAELTITDTIPSDQGLYRVVASNDIGESDLFFSVNILETTPSPVSSTPSQDTGDELMGVYIGSGVGVGVVVLLLVALAVLICYRRRQKSPEMPSTTQSEAKKKKPKSLSELSMEKGKPLPPPSRGKPEVPRYSTQLKTKKREGAMKVPPQQESYEQPTRGGEVLYEQDLYEELQPTEYYND